MPSLQHSTIVIDIDAALAALSLEDKCRFVAGKTTWRTNAFPDAGIPQLKMSDGPNGVRGEGHGGSGTPGVVVPAGITLGAAYPAPIVDHAEAREETLTVYKRALDSAREK